MTFKIKKEKQYMKTPNTEKIAKLKIPKDETNQISTRQQTQH